MSERDLDLLESLWTLPQSHEPCLSPARAARSSALQIGRTARRC
jgi:hypothetical protein